MLQRRELGCPLCTLCRPEPATEGSVAALPGAPALPPCSLSSELSAQPTAGATSSAARLSRSATSLRICSASPSARRAAPEAGSPGRWSSAGLSHA